VSALGTLASLPSWRGSFDPEVVYGPFPRGMRARPESSQARAERKRGRPPCGPDRLGVRPRTTAGSGPDELLEGRLLADRIEVRVPLRVVAELLELVDRLPEVLDRVGRAAREGLAASEVVQRRGVLRIGLDQLTSPLDDALVVTGLVQRPERRPDLPAVRLVRLPRDAADREDRRPSLVLPRRVYGPDA